jgi:hypothetical protein
MPILTQRNAKILGAIAFGWAAAHNTGGIPDWPWTHFVGPMLVGALAFMASMGFDVTPNGGKLPDEIKKLPPGVDAPSPIADMQTLSKKETE